MNTSFKPAALFCVSATFHIRSSSAMGCPYVLGTVNELPPSDDLPTTMFDSSRLEYARLSSVAGLGIVVALVSFGPIAQSQSPPPTLESGKPMSCEDDPSWVTRKPE